MKISYGNLETPGNSPVSASPSDILTDVWIGPAKTPMVLSRLESVMTFRGALPTSKKVSYGSPAEPDSMSLTNLDFAKFERRLMAKLGAAIAQPPHLLSAYPAQTKALMTT